MLPHRLLQPIGPDVTIPLDPTLLFLGAVSGMCTCTWTFPSIRKRKKKKKHAHGRGGGRTGRTTPRLREP